MTRGRGAARDQGAIERQRRGSAEGAEIVRATFGAAITRRRFAELVGVNPTTVRRWEAAGVIAPKQEVILGSPTMVFERADVEFGRRLIGVLRSRPGSVSLRDAAEIVRANHPR